MNISGSLDELEFIVHRAASSKAEVIQFAPNGDVWILYSSESYVYLKTTLFVESSVFFPNTAIQNLNRLFRRSKSKRSTSVENIHSRAVEMTNTYVQFGYSEESKINAFTGMERSSEASALSHKLRSLINSVYEINRPHMRLSTKMLEKYNSDINQEARVLGVSESTYKFDPMADETENHFHMPEYELSATHKFKENGSKTFTYDDGYFVPRSFKTVNIYLSDSDLTFLRRVGKIFRIEEFYIIPLKKHYIIEAHEGDMVFKMFLSRSKHLEWSDVL